MSIQMIVTSDFNPLPPCGGRPRPAKPPSKSFNFNPLPPCGGRPSLPRNTLWTARFQSTPSVWRETQCHGVSLLQRLISIHSLRVEGDQTIQLVKSAIWYFNPLPPCGGRPLWTVAPTRSDHFNPLPPCGGRPPRIGWGANDVAISIHSLRVEGDLNTGLATQKHLYFNPLPPCGGRPCPVLRESLLDRHFNPLPPCGGRPPLL